MFDDGGMRNFFLAAQQKNDELPIQHRVSVIAFSTVVLASLVIVPFNFVGDVSLGDWCPVVIEGVYLTFVVGAVVTFLATRDLGHARLLLGLGLFVLSAYLVQQAGGPRGTGLFYFLSSFPLLYFVLGLRAGLVFTAAFFVGFLVRVLAFPLDASSVFADPDLRGKFVLVFAVASALGLTAMTYQHRLIRYLSRVAFEDSVTGLWNRSRLTEHLKVSVRGPDPFALLALKLYHFDEVGQHWGMAMGDKVMGLAGRRLQGCLPPGAVAGRWSGTLFLLRVDTSEVEPLQELCRTLMKAVAQPMPAEEVPVSLYPGMAVTRYPEDGQTIDRLVANLTLTLAQGEDQVGEVRLFNEAAWATEQRRFQIAAALEGAVGREEMSLVYQPKVRLTDRTYQGAEVLLRWTHPHLGVVPPAEFIPIAESTGYIRDITWFVIDRFLEDYPVILSAWGRGPLPGAHAVNLSPVDLGQGQLREYLLARLGRHNLSPDVLELEITEGVMMSSDPRVQSVLKGLKEAGFRLAIDDFGTGYSSLSYLHRLEAQTLKIDQSFVRQLGSVSTMPPIVDAVLSMGKALRMTVVAEGVETEAQAAHLVERGCTLAQGWLFSRALAKNEYLEWIRRS
jgi:diguanylate cyclase (GGDEF)-like protein